MSEVVLGIVIGSICGSLLTAAYIGICLREENEGRRNWIDRAIARAFAAVEDPTLEDLPPQ